MEGGKGETGRGVRPRVEWKWSSSFQYPDPCEDRCHSNGLRPTYYLHGKCKGPSYYLHESGPGDSGSLGRSRRVPPLPLSLSPPCPVTTPDPG